MLTVIVAVVELPGVTELEDKLQVALVGAPPQLNLTASVNAPPTLAILIVYVAVAPAFRVLLVGALVRLKSEPVPVRPMVCGLFCALLVTVSVPERLPEAVGVKVTATVQADPGERVDGQLLVCAKSPVACNVPTLKGRLPVLETVTVCGALEVPSGRLENVKLAGATLAPGVPEPVPLSVIEWGEPAASS